MRKRKKKKSFDLKEALRFCYWYCAKYRPAGMEFDESFSLAMIGLDQAIRRYDPKRGAWSTMTAMCIRREWQVQLMWEHARKRTVDEQYLNEVESLHWHSNDYKTSHIDCARILQGAGLTDCETRLLRARYFQELSFTEIGREAGYSHEWVRVNLRRALEKCRNYVSKDL